MFKNKFKLMSTLLLVFIYPMDASSDYLFTAPPRESVERGVEIYKPIADYLSKATGERFSYQHPQSWSEYSRGMQNKEYDLVFDGPHFVSWRLQYIEHDVLAKLPQLLTWRVLIRIDNKSVKSLDDLVGKTICAPKSPNFGMLTVMSIFQTLIKNRFM